VSLNIKPTVRPTGTRSLTAIVLGTALVLTTYVTPIASLPIAAVDLGAGPAARTWMLNSMSLGLAAALLVAGELGDNYGRRRVYVVGLGALGAGALGCALAQEPILFVAARVVEGVGGAAVLACGLAVLAHDYQPGAARVHATSMWGAGVGIGITLGALVSAAFSVRWRESYAVVAVVVVVFLILTLSRVAESKTRERRRVDVVGLTLLTTAMTLLVSALTLGRNGIDVITAALAVAGLVSLVGFAAAESRAAQPLVEPELLRHPRFRAASIGSFTLGAGIVAMSSSVPTFAQLGLHTGLWMASTLLVAWSGTSVITSYLIRYLPRPLEGGWPIAGLLTITAVGQLLAFGLHTSSSPLRLLAPMLVAGLATGILNALLGREAVASVTPDRAAMGSGAINTARFLGAAVGITLFVVVATHTGAEPVGGWNTAVLVSSAITLLGAAAVAIGAAAARSSRA
jgi:MFS family permease